MSSNFNNLTIIKANDTSELIKLKSNIGIERVEIEGSKLLRTPSLMKRVPEVLLSRNNMADYTSVRVNGVQLSPLHVQKLKEGKGNLQHGDLIEILDGALAGHTFQLIFGLPLNELFGSPEMINHLKDRLGKPAVTSIVTQDELDSVRWIGMDPSLVTESNYRGYFAGRIITDFRGIELLRNLEYINFSGAIIPSEFDLTVFRQVSNLNYSFKECPSLTRVKVKKNIATAISSFESCNNLRVIEFEDNEFSIDDSTKMFSLCRGIEEIIIPTVITGTTYTDIFKDANVQMVRFSDTTLKEIPSYAFIYDLLNSAYKIDLSNMTELLRLRTTLKPNSRTIELDISNTKVDKINFSSSTNMMNNLVTLTANNTIFLRELKSNGVIRNLNIEGSQLLSFIDKVPYMLRGESSFSYNNLIINGTDATQQQVQEIRNGTFDLENVDTIEIKDGFLAGVIFSKNIDATEFKDVFYLFSDEKVATFVKDIVFNSKYVDRLSLNQQMLDTITTFNASGVNVIEGLVTSMYGLKFLRNMTRLDLERLDFPGTVDLRNNLKLANLEDTFCNSTVKKVIFPDVMENLTNMRFAFEYSSVEEVVMPSSAPNLIAFDSAFKYSNVREVIMPQDAVNITNMYDAFYNCDYLTRAVLPPIMNKCTSLYKCFDNCDILTEVVLPSSAEICTTIQNMFWGCGQLSSVTLPSNMPALETMSGAFCYCYSLSTFSLPAYTPNLSRCEAAFRDCREIQSFNLRNENFSEVTHFTEMLRGCSKLSSVTIGDSINKAVDIRYMFYGASSIRTLNLSSMDLSKLTEASYLCYGCSSLTSIILPNNLEMLTSLYAAFSGTTSLTSITLPSNLNNLTDLTYAFERTGLSSITLPSMPALANMRYAFNGCANITRVVIPAICNKIENMQSTFNNCAKLTSITLPETLDELKTMYRTFAGCNTITNISLPQQLPSVTSMYDIFSECNKLTSMTLPATLPNLTEIDAAFYNCYELRTVYLPSSLPKLKSAGNMLRSCSALTNISRQIESAPLLENAYGMYYNCRSLVSGKLPSDSLNLTNINSAFYSCVSIKTISIPETLSNVTDGGYFIAYCAEIESLSLPDAMNSLTSLSNFAYNATKLKSIKMPVRMDSLQNMNYSFHQSGILEIDLPDSLPELINMEATFAYCRGLTRVKIPSSLPKFERGYRTFEECTVLETINMPTSMPRLNTMYKMFEDCRSLKNLTFPTSLPEVVSMYDAFDGAASLKSIEFTSLPKVTDMYNTFRASGFADIKLPASMPELITCNAAFADCSHLENVQLFENAPKLEDMSYMFSNSFLYNKPITLPRTNAIKTIRNAFYRCRSLSKVVFREDCTYNEVTSIENIFYDCNNMLEIKLPNEMNKLENVNSAFRGCRNTQVLYLPLNLSSVTTAENVFASFCDYYHTIKLPPRNIPQQMIDGIPDAVGGRWIYHADSFVLDINDIKRVPVNSIPDYINLPNIMEQEGDNADRTPIPSTGKITDIFKDATVASSIRWALDKPNLYSVIETGELDSVTWFGDPDSGGGHNGVFPWNYVHSWSGIELLKNVRYMKLQEVQPATEEAKTFDFSMWENMEFFNEAFCGNSTLTTLKLPKKCTKLRDMGMWGSKTVTRTIYFPTKVPLITNNNHFKDYYDFAPFTIIFYEDSSITSKSQLPFHDASGNCLFVNATVDYSNLSNLS